MSEQHCATCTCDDGPQCGLCGFPLHDGQRLVDAFMFGKPAGQVHSACAREAEGQAR